VIAVALVTCLGAAAGTPAAARAPAAGTVVVTVSTPAGVPANVVVRSNARRVLSKSPKRRSARFKLSVAAGSVRIVAPRVAFGGALYAARVSRPGFTLRRRAAVRVRVVYKVLPTATRLYAVAVTRDRISLRWHAPARAVVLLRRKLGERPPATAREGTKVATRRRAADDRGLKPGTRYSYALFTRVGRRWLGPITAQAGTASYDPRVAAYVAPPSTVIVKPGERDTATVRAGGVDVVLAPGRPTPLEGAGFVMPISPELPGGFLGKVTSVSPDGRKVRLTGAAITDAFDLYKLDAPIGGSGPVPSTTPPGTSRAPRARLRGGLNDCLNLGASVSIIPNLTLNPTGRLLADIVHDQNTLLAAAVTADLLLRPHLTVSFDIAAAVACSLAFPKLPFPISLVPVPISLVIDPTWEFGVEAALTLRNADVSAATGFLLSAVVGLQSFEHHGTVVGEITQPPSVAATVRGYAAAGLAMTLGPGGGTVAAGAVAGIGGKIGLKTSFGKVADTADPQHSDCTRLATDFQIEANLNAKAWWGVLKVERSLTIPALTKTIPLYESYSPARCEPPVPPVPPPPPPPPPLSPARLVVTQTAPPGAFPGQDFDFRIRVTNVGGQAARDVELLDVAPAAGHLVSLSVPPTNPFLMPHIISLGDLAGGDSTTVTVRWHAPDGDATLTNRAKARTAPSYLPNLPHTESEETVATVTVGANAGCSPCGVTAAGTGLRNRDHGTILMTDLPSGASVTRAVLVWAVLPKPGVTPANTITFEGHRISADLTSSESGTLCWNDGMTHGYAADVTPYVGGNGTFDVSDPPQGTIRVDAEPIATLPYTDGATLVVFYEGGGANDQVLADFSYSTSTSDEGITRAFGGIQSVGGPARLILAGPDGQSAPEALTLSGASELVLPNTWDGGDPQDGPSFRIGNLWDTDRFDVTSLLPAGQATLGVHVRHIDDCVGLSAALLSVRRHPGPL